MSEAISVREKKFFLRNLLKKYDFRRSDIYWIKNYLLDNDRLLNRMRFVDDPDSLNNVIIITSKCAENPTVMQLVSDKVVYTDFDEINSMIRESARKKYYLYIEVSDSLYASNPYFVKVVEENKKATATVSHQSKEDGELLVSLIMTQQEVKHLLEKIDEAIDKNDKKSFLTYTEKLKVLQESLG